MAGEKKKIWDIEIPLLRQKLQGIAVSPDALVGKMMKIDMTRMLKGKNIDAAFTIVKRNDKLEADFYSITLLQGYIKRMMRKSITWIEDSFVCQAKDTKLEIKPFFITKKKIHRSLRTGLRSKAKEYIIQFVAEKNAQEIFDSIVHGELQKGLSSNLKNICQLALCEIRVCKIKK